MRSALPTTPLVGSHSIQPDPDLFAEHPQIVTVARPQHHPMLAKRDRPRVAVSGLVVDGQDRHGHPQGACTDFRSTLLPQESKNRGNCA